MMGYARESLARIERSLDYIIGQLRRLDNATSEPDEYCADCPLCPGTSMEVWVVVTEDVTDSSCGTEGVFDNSEDAHTLAAALRAGFTSLDVYVTQHEMEVNDP